MADYLRTNWQYLIGAALLHALFAGIFGLTMIQMSRNAPPPQLAIQAVVIDSSQIRAASRRLEQEREQQRAEQAAQQKREREAAAQREAEQRAERERQVEVQRRQEEEQKRQAEERMMI